MNQRERVLAIVVGLLVAGFVVKFVFDAYSSRVTRLKNQRQDLVDKQSKNETTTLRAKRAAKQMAEFESASLPADTKLATSLYKLWLHDITQEAKIQGANISSRMNPVPYGDVYQQLSFSVVMECDKEQLARWLYEFYRIERLHRIRSLIAKPEAGESKKADIRMTIEALSLATAPNAAELSSVESQKLLFANYEDYRNTVVARDFFGPGNKPPEFTSPPRHEILVGSRDGIQLRADAGEDGQRVRFDLISSELEGVEVDPGSGRIRVTLASPGQFNMVVKATDTGLPAKSVEQQITVVAKNPPPPVAFDKAKFVRFTGWFEGGKGGEYISLRDLTAGKNLNLREGDEFDLGEIRGVVREISDRFALVEMNDREWLIKLGKTLEDAEAVDKPRDAAGGE